MYAVRMRRGKDRRWDHKPSWASHVRRVEVSDTEKSIARVLESYASAVFARDVEAFMRLYDPSVRVFDAWGVWSYEGSAAWQRAVEGWFTSLGAERVKSHS